MTEYKRGCIQTCMLSDWVAYFEWVICNYRKSMLYNQCVWFECNLDLLLSHSVLVSDSCSWTFFCTCYFLCFPFICMVSKYVFIGCYGYSLVYWLTHTCSLFSSLVCPVYIFSPQFVQYLLRCFSCSLSSLFFVYNSAAIRSHSPHFAWPAVTTIFVMLSLSCDLSASAVSLHCNSLQLLYHGLMG